MHGVGPLPVGISNTRIIEKPQDGAASSLKSIGPGRRRIPLDPHNQRQRVLGRFIPAIHA
jgi:hypothetical protein